MRSISAVMTAAALPGLGGGKQQRQRGLHTVPEPDDPIADLRPLIESFDFEMKFTKNFVGPVEALGRSDQTDIIPHRMTEGEPVLGDQGRVRRLALVVPRRDLPNVIGPPRSHLLPR